MDSTKKMGKGEYIYEVVPEWENLPPGIGWREVAGVTIDSQGRIYLFSRGDHPMNVFDREGNFISS